MAVVELVATGGVGTCKAGTGGGEAEADGYGFDADGIDLDSPPCKTESGETRAGETGAGDAEFLRFDECLTGEDGTDLTEAGTGDAGVGGAENDGNRADLDSPPCEVDAVETEFLPLDEDRTGEVGTELEGTDVTGFGDGAETGETKDAKLGTVPKTEA